MCLTRFQRAGCLVVSALALLSPCANAQSAAKISVGKNVQISKDRGDVPHQEPLMATDPLNANRLLAASHIHYADSGGIRSILYSSNDGGKTWAVSLDPRDSTVTDDVAMTYTPDGSAVFATLAQVGIFRSRDGGKTWGKPTKYPHYQGIDREYLIADFNPKSKYYGRVYMNATTYPASVDTGSTASAISLFSSLDSGTTFQNPILKIAYRPRWILGMANSVVMSNGAVASLFGIMNKYGTWGYESTGEYLSPTATLNVTISKDGGQTIAEKHEVAPYYMNRPRSEGAVIPWIAVDPGSTLFKDRLYVVWSDFRARRLQIMLSYSSDSGKTWSQPRVIDDNRTALDPKDGPDAIDPVVAVNKDGAVMVTWYDRREAKDNLGWYLRASASLDGGDTWSPSVHVSDAPTRFDDATWNLGAYAYAGGAASQSGGSELHVSLSQDNFSYSPGHTSGFAAAADGSFHAVWVDYRTGVAQLWTAPITITGTVAKNGGGDLTELADLGAQYGFVITKRTRDPGSNKVTLTMRLKNMTKKDSLTPGDTLRASTVKLRALAMSSDVGVPRALNADNNLPGPGAIWDFSKTLPPNGLLPDSLGAPKDLVFQLSDLRPFRQAGENKFGILDLTARVLGTPPPKKSK